MLWLRLVGLNIEDPLVVQGSSRKDDVASRFLNRILGLEIARQQWLFDYFALYLVKVTNAAIRDGGAHRGVKGVYGRQCAFGDERIVGVKTPVKTPVTVRTIFVDRGLAFEDARKMLRAVTAAPSPDVFGSRDGFRRSSTNDVVLVLEKGEASIRGLAVKDDKFVAHAPDGEPVVMTYFKARREYAEELTPGDAKVVWDAAFRRRSTRNSLKILAGPLLYVWAALLRAQYKEGASTSEGGVRVVRAEDSNTHEGLLGALLHADKADAVIRSLQGVREITDTQLTSGVGAEKKREAARQKKLRNARAEKGLQTRQRNQRRVQIVTTYLKDNDLSPEDFSPPEEMDEGEDGHAPSPSSAPPPRSDVIDLTTAEESSVVDLTMDDFYLQS